MTASFPHPRSVSSARSIGAGVFVRDSGPVRVGKGRSLEFPATHSHVHRAAPKFQRLDGSRRDIHPAVQAFSRSRLLAAGLNWCGLLARSSSSSALNVCQDQRRCISDVNQSFRVAPLHVPKHAAKARLDVVHQ